LQPQISLSRSLRSSQMTQIRIWIRCWSLYCPMDSEESYGLLRRGNETLRYAQGEIIDFVNNLKYS